MKKLLSLVFILICIPSHAANEAYQQQTADLIAILKNIETQNKQLQTEVDAYTKEKPKKASKAEVRPRPKVDQKPPTLPTPMDRKAMSSAIFFAGGAPRPIPQKRANNFRSPIKSDTSSNSGTNKDNPSTDDQSDSKDSDSSDSSTSSGYSSYSGGGGGGGYYPPYNNQKQMSFITTDTSDPTFSYPPTPTPAFTFSEKLTLSQSAFQSIYINNIYTNITLTSVKFCDSNFSTSTCFSAGDFSSNILNISNATIEKAKTKGFVGFTESSSDSSVQTPTFYFLGTDTNSKAYKYTINYPSQSTDLSCSSISGNTSCKQQQSTLTQAISLSQ